MIRIRDIALPPEHNVNQLQFEAAQLLKVPKLGPKAFEQCAGFLRVPESKSVLDNTGVHPESYAAAEKLLEYDTVYYTGHCTGEAQYEKLKKVMGDRLQKLSSGVEIVI